MNPLKLLSTFVICGLLFSCQPARYASIEVQLGVNQEQKPPDEFTRFESRDIEAILFYENDQIHFIINFFATANLSNYREVNVSFSVPYNLDLLVFFQFGTHQPTMRIVNNRRYYNLDFRINENHAFVFTLLPLSPMDISLSLISNHAFTGLPSGGFPLLIVGER